MALHSFSPRPDALQQTHPEPRLPWICGLACPQARHEERYAFACALPLQALICLYLTVGPVRDVEGRPEAFYSALNSSRTVLSGKVWVRGSPRSGSITAQLRNLRQLFTRGSSRVDHGSYQLPGDTSMDGTAAAAHRNGYSTTGPDLPMM